MNLPTDMILEVMDFLPEQDVYQFPDLIETHRRLRTAVSPIHCVGDLNRARRFPKCRLSLFVYDVELYSHLEPDEFPRVVNLYTSRFIPPFFYNLTYLNISHSRIRQLPVDLPSLRELNCSYTLIDVIPDCYTDLDTLDISHSCVSTLPDTLTKLSKLIAYDCFLSELSPLFTDLKELDIGQTYIEALPDTFKWLIKLECRFSPLKRVPETYTRLERLDCAFTDAEIPDCIRRLPMRFFREKSIYQINFYLGKR